MTHCYPHFLSRTCSFTIHIFQLTQQWIVIEGQDRIGWQDMVQGYIYMMGRPTSTPLSTVQVEQQILQQKEVEKRVYKEPNRIQKRLLEDEK